MADIQQDTKVLEFRPYITQPGKRDEFNGLFEKLIPDLEARGQRILGQFRDAKDPNKFLWLRGYDSMETRGKALPAFYEGPVWKEYAKPVNATLVDIGDVRLLKPVDSTGFTLAKKMTAFMVATIYLLNAPAENGFNAFWKERLAPTMAQAGAPSMAQLSTEYAPDNFPRIPVTKAGEHAFVWFAAYGSPDEYELHRKILSGAKGWSATEAELAKYLASPTQTMELIPTAYSLQRWGTPFKYTLAGTGDVHDFDFLDGKWTMVNRRLMKRGVGSTDPKDWDVFPATVTAHVLMNGVANVDEVLFPTKGWNGVTFRHFDLAKKQWSIYWVNSRDGKMDVPGQVGGFEGDVGLFYGEDTDGGRPVKVVYKWTKVGPDGARWEQAFSFDDGKTWETNWVNEHRRVKPEVGSRDFDFEFGEWTVQHRTKRADGTWAEFSGTSVTRPAMDGMGNVEENRFHKPGGVTRGLALRTYDAKVDQWAIWWVDGRDPHAALDPPVKGRFVDGVGTFYSESVVGGKSVRTRFIWSKITATTARWEQALSTDSGPWETNWTMEFTRVK